MIKFKAIGAGAEKVLVLHDWLGDHRNYQQVERYLNQERFTWVFPDFRGYGLSRDIAGDYSLSEVVSDLRNLVNSLNFETFSIISHSMSGLVAFRAALDLGARVEKIIASAPVTANGLELDADGIAFFESAAVDQAVCQQVIDAVTGHRYGPEWKKLKARIAFESSLAEARLGYLRNMLLKEQFAEETKRLHQPVLFLCGRHDAEGFTAEGTRAKVSGCLANAAFSVVEEAGHYMMEEAPVRFASLAQAFLRA